MKWNLKYISQFDIENGNTYELKCLIQKYKLQLDSIQLPEAKIDDLRKDATFEGKEPKWYIIYWKYIQYFNDINEDYKVYDSNDLRWLNLELQDLYKTKELVKLSNYKLPKHKSEVGIELEKDNVYYLMRNEFIKPTVENYLLSTLKKYYDSSYIRISKDYKSINGLNPSLTQGAIAPLTWRFDKNFKKKKKFDASYSTAYKNEGIKNSKYNSYYERDRSLYPSDKFKTDISISKYNNFEILIEGLEVKDNKIIGKCIHATIEFTNGHLNEVCEHIDLSINIYDLKSNRFEYCLDKKIEASKRIHFFRINDSFMVNEIPDMALNILDVKSNIYEIMADIKFD